MGNITGALIENAFQPQTSLQEPLDVQEEIKTLSRDSSKRELYRLLHAEMEHTTLDRGIASSSHSSMFTSDSDHSEKREARRNSITGEEHSLLRSNTNCPGASKLMSVVAESNNKDVIKSRNFGVHTEVQEDESNSKMFEQSKLTHEHDATVETRMAFKKKLLINYRTENEDIGAKEEKSALVEVDKDVTCDEAGTKHVANTTDSSDTRVESLGDSEAKMPMKILNINSCIEVIVMNELKKQDSSLPSELQSYDLVPYFGMSNPEHSKGQEVMNRDEHRDKGSLELNRALKGEAVSRSGSDTELMRERRLQQCHGYPSDAAASSFSACSDTSQQHLMAGKLDFSQHAGLACHVPSSFRGESFVPESGFTQNLPRGYLPSTVSEGPSRNRVMLNQAAGSSSGELSGEVYSQHHGQILKYSPSGALSRRRDISPAQSLPLAPHAAEMGYRIIPGGQLQSLQGLDHRRKTEKELEQAKYQRSEYLPLPNLPQCPSISGLGDQNVRYQSSPQVLMDKLHIGEGANYLYPGKASRDRMQSQYEPATQHDSLQPPMAGYLKHFQRNLPAISSAYEKDNLRLLPSEQHCQRSDITKVNALANTSLSSGSDYRMSTEPRSQMYYQSEQLVVQNANPPDKRSFQFQHGMEEFDPDRRIKRTMNSNRGGEFRNMPTGSEQSIHRPHSSSYQKCRESMEKIVSGSTEETPLDLTVKKNFANIHHHASGYQLPPSSKHHLPEWEIGRKGGGYRHSTNDDDQVRARVFRPSVPNGPDFDISEMQTRELVDPQNIFNKVHGLQVLPSESDALRGTPASVNERSLTRISVIASHPFEDVQKNPLPRLTMQHLTEAFAKNSGQQVGAWKQSSYPESLPRSRAHTLESDSVARLTVETGRPEQPRARPTNSGSDLLQPVTTSPTIPHLSPVQPFASTTGLQQSGTRRGPVMNILGSHPPSDILHLQCKICSSTYGSLRSFRMHFAKVHGLEPLPEHCNISTISGTKNAMSRNSVEDSEPPSLQRETAPSDVVALGKPHSFYSFEPFGNNSRNSKADPLRSEVPLASTRPKQVAEVYPMPARVSCGLSPQLKIESQMTTSAKHPDLTESRVKPNDTRMKLTSELKTTGGHMINCDLGIFRIRNCYSNMGCDRDADCPECLDGFKDISDCKMHISTHMMRSCTCKACDLSFTHSGALNKHLLTVHSGTEKVEVEYRCLFCREAFSDEKVLFHHTREHEKRYSRLEMVPQDNTSGLMNFRQQGRINDTDCIQKAVPDTTCTDDARPTSEFGENSSNVSPVYLPGTESKGISYDRKSVWTGLAEDTNGKKTENSYVEEDKNLRTCERDADFKVKVERQNSDLPHHDRSWSLESSKSESESLNTCKGPASLLSFKADVCEPQTEGKMEAKGRAEVVESEKLFKPMVSSKPSDDGCMYMSKKRALLHRFQSGEDRDSIEKDSHSDQVDVSLSRTTSVSRSSGMADGEKPKAVQPLYLKEIFTRINEQVESSIRSSSIPDLSHLHVPASSSATKSKSRCVRDVCDEIIAQSFLEDNCSREPVASSSLLNGVDMNLKAKVNEQLKLLVRHEHEEQPDLSASRTVADSCYSQGWSRSPCSSHDSCHSLEIDESEYDKELSDTAEGGADRTYPKKGMDAQEESCRSVESTVALTSPKQMCSGNDQGEHDKYQAVDKGKVCVGKKNFLAGEEEDSTHTESAFTRLLTNSEGNGSECIDDCVISLPPKETGSPSLMLTQNQEASTEKDDILLIADGSNSLPAQIICSEQAETTATKRKHLPDACKETAENEPPLKKPAP